MTVECETAAVIVTLRDSERLRHTIAALRDDLDGEDAAIICVLNNPGDTQALVRDGVRYVGAGMNLGWAGGIHAGLLDVDSEYVWCIQDDLIVRPGAHAALRSALQDDPGLGSVRPLPVGDDAMVARGNVTSTVDDSGRFSRPIPPLPTPPSEVELHSGSFLPSSAQFIRRSAWDSLGGFDPWFYPWGAIDVDFGRSLRGSGWRFRTVPQALMLHASGGSTNSTFRDLMAVRQLSLYAAKWSPDEMSALVDPVIVQNARAGRSQPREVTLEALQRVAGICAADLVLFFMRQLPELLARERALLEGQLGDAVFERDAALADLGFVTAQFHTAAQQRDSAAEDRDQMATSRAWRAVTRYRQTRDRILRRSG